MQYRHLIGFHFPEITFVSSCEGVELVGLCLRPFSMTPTLSSPSSSFIRYLIFYFVKYCETTVNIPISIHPSSRCFIPNIYAALCTAVLVPLICLVAVLVVFIHAYQVTQQWKAYDDVYRGRTNSTGMRHTCRHVKKDTNTHMYEFEIELIQ